MWNNQAKSSAFQHTGLSLAFLLPAGTCFLLFTWLLGNTVAGSEELLLCFSHEVCAGRARSTRWPLRRLLAMPCSDISHPLPLNHLGLCREAAGGVKNFEEWNSFTTNVKWV